MKPAISIISKNMPGFPGVVAYEITGDTCDAVQREIDRFFRQIEKTDGCAEFHNPTQMMDGRYTTHGYTFVTSAEVRIIDERFYSEANAPLVE